MTTDFLYVKSSSALLNKTALINYNTFFVKTQRLIYILGLVFVLLSLLCWEFYVVITGFQSSKFDKIWMQIFFSILSLFYITHSCEKNDRKSTLKIAGSELPEAFKWTEPEMICVS